MEIDIIALLLVFILFLIAYSIGRVSGFGTKMGEIFSSNLRDHNARQERVAEIESTLQFLSFIRNITLQIAVFEFNTYRDNHDMTKVTIHPLKEITQKTAKTVFDSIKDKDDRFAEGVLDQQFYMKYIVDTATEGVKALFARAELQGDTMNDNEWSENLYDGLNGFNKHNPNADFK